LASRVWVHAMTQQEWKKTHTTNKSKDTMEK